MALRVTVRLPEIARTMRVLRYPHCVNCGRTFPAWTISALVCSPVCAQRRWRACAMLAGTHGNVNGKFVRIRGAA